MVWGVIWLGEMHTVPETVTEKVQAYPTAKTMKEVQRIWGFRGLLFPTWHRASLAVLPGQERACVGLGLRAARGL